MKYTVVFRFPNEIEYPDIEAKNSDEAIDIAFDFLMEYTPDIYIVDEKEGN